MPTTPPNLIAGNFYKCNGGNSVPYIYMDNTLREVTTHEIGKLADYDNRDTWENAIKILPIGACDAIPRGDPLITSPYQNKMVQCEEDGSYSLITHGHRRPYATTRSDSEPAFLNPGVVVGLPDFTLNAIAAEDPKWREKLKTIKCKPYPATNTPLYATNGTMGFCAGQGTILVAGRERTIIGAPLFNQMKEKLITPGLVQEFGCDPSNAGPAIAVPIGGTGPGKLGVNINRLDTERVFSTRMGSITGICDIANVASFDDPTNCQYVFNDLKAVDALTAFKNTVTQDVYDRLMHDMVMTPCSDCPDGNKFCSYLKGTSALANHIQTWFGKQPPGEQDIMMGAICNKHTDMPECKCLNRQLDPDYMKWVNRLPMSDSCWYIACKNTVQNLVTNVLQRPTCPQNVCQVIYDIHDVTGSVEFSQNTNLITCTGAPPGPNPNPTPTPTPTPTPKPTPTPTPTPTPAPKPTPSQSSDLVILLKRNMFVIIGTIVIIVLGIGAVKLL